MPPRLIARPGSLDERAFDLKLGSNTVGRTRENDVCLADPSLSRAHARIDVTDSVIVLHDLKSKNGTSVDGARVERQVLGDVHTILFGDVECRFVRQVSPS